MGTQLKVKMAFHVAKGAVKATGFRYAVSKWMYYASYFPQLGLRADDTLAETPVVKEALRRLPEAEQDARMFRIMRAFDLSTKKIVLPKEEWTKFEEDDRYLEPYIEQVKKEMAEKKEWFKKIEYNVMFVFYFLYSKCEIIKVKS